MIAAAAIAASGAACSPDDTDTSAKDKPAEESSNSAEPASEWCVETMDQYWYHLEAGQLPSDEEEIAALAELAPSPELADAVEISREWWMGHQQGVAPGLDAATEAGIRALAADNVENCPAEYTSILAQAIAEPANDRADLTASDVSPAEGQTGPASAYKLAAEAKPLPDLSQAVRLFSVTEEGWRFDGYQVALLEADRSSLNTWDGGRPVYHIGEPLWVVTVVATNMGDDAWVGQEMPLTATADWTQPDLGVALTTRVEESSGYTWLGFEGWHDSDGEHPLVKAGESFHATELLPAVAGAYQISGYIWTYDVASGGSNTEITFTGDATFR
jgi:hypothetical protein